MGVCRWCLSESANGEQKIDSEIRCSPIPGIIYFFLFRNIIENRIELNAHTHTLFMDGQIALEQDRRTSSSSSS